MPEPTSIHWHGVFVPAGMDGVGGLTQPAIAPGKTFKYEFAFDRAGTFMYHPHVDEMTQIALGMMGMIVVHPRGGETATRRVRDYALMTHEMTVPIGTRRPVPLAMNDFNVLTFNGVAFPATESLVAEVGDLRAHPAREPRPDGSPPDPPARSRVRGRRDRRWQRAAVARVSPRRPCSCRWAPCASSSSPHARPVTGRCTAT